MTDRPVASVFAFMISSTLCARVAVLGGITFDSRAFSAARSVT
jgi:hypothetical protein